MRPQDIVNELHVLGRQTGGKWFGLAMDMIGPHLGRHEGKITDLERRVSNLEQTRDRARRPT